jgi:hypothetical protein
MSKLLLSMMVLAAIGCGVKGPPEPPLVTEASLKKEQQVEAQTAPPTPVPVIPAKAPAKKTKSSKSKAQ